MRFGVFVPQGWRMDPVSYTHLDVYKRQVVHLAVGSVPEGPEPVAQPRHQGGDDARDDAGTGESAG